MAGVDAVYDAAFQRAGMVRVYQAEDMFDCAELLARHRPPQGPRLAIVTNAGGPGVMATDELLERRGTLAALSPETLQAAQRSTAGPLVARQSGGRAGRRRARPLCPGARRRG